MALTLTHHKFPLKIHNFSSIPKHSLTRPLICKKNYQISLNISLEQHSAPIPILYCFTPIEEEKSHSTRIFIKGLSKSVPEGFLAKTFARFGQVNRVKIIMDKKSIESLGFAYVWFTNEDAAQSAVKEMDAKFFCGRFIAVTIAKPESPTSHTRTPQYTF